MTSLAQKTITLVTGGNGGIGFEVVAGLIASQANHVLLGSRSIEKGQAAVSQLEARKPQGTVEVLQLDITDNDSIQAAAKTIESKYGRVDAVVNNAAVATSEGPVAEQMEISFRTNATGPLLVVDAFAPLLRRALGTPRIINVSSGAGSIEKRLDTKSPAYKIKAIPYRASKAAMNMITACQAAEYGDEGFKVFSFCPGFTQSNLSPQNTAESGAKPASEAAAPIVAILGGERDSEHAHFLHSTGQYGW